MDTLTLTRLDVERLADMLSRLQAEPPRRAWQEAGFERMIEAILAYVREHPERESYHCENHY